MDVISILRKKRQNVTSFDVQLDADQTDTQPHVFTHIMIRYIIRGHNVRPAAVERAIELSVTKYCPAQAMLEKAVTIEHSYEIIEETAGVENEQILAPAP
jgi:putative redox protein